MHIPNALQGTLIFFFVLFLLRVLLRRQWLAVVVFVAMWATMNSLQGDYIAVQAPAMVLVYGLAALAVVRFGLVTLAAGIFTADVLLNVPFTLDFSNWYAGSTAFVLLSILALTGWGFYTSLAGQRLLKDDLFQ